MAGRGGVGSGAVAVPALLKGALTRRRLGDDPAVVVVHGRAAQSAPWLAQFIAAKVRY